MCEWNGDFGVTIDEMTVEVGKTEEGLNVLDLPGLGPILDDLEFVWGHGKAFGGQHISEVLTASDVKLIFVYMGKNSISTESAEYFLDMGFVLGDVVQIDGDNDVNHFYEDVICKPLKSCRCISKPFKALQTT